MRALLLAGLVALVAAPAGAACRQALALGLDVSGSVDADEYRLQLDGLAGALMQRDVQAALLAIPDAPVRLHVFEWAGSGQRRVLVPWTEVTDTGVLAAIAARLTGASRVAQDPGTALGEAMLAGAAALAEQPDCWRRTLDISGDGQSNSGPRPRDVRGDALLAGVTVNALVIVAPPPAVTRRPDAPIADLVAYFRFEVIQGPEAFAEVAAGYADYEDAMARKLLKELETMPMGALDR